MTHYKCSAYLDGGHDMVFVSIEFRADNRMSASHMFHAAMTQLGFKHSDYGYVAISPVATP